MGPLFCIGLVLYALVLRQRRRRAGTSRQRHGGSELSWILWGLYFALGLSASLIDLGDVLVTVYAANYTATLYLLGCIIISIHGFRLFDAHHLAPMLERPLPGQRWLEAFLITIQAGSIAFFTPFAVQSLVGDPNTNRLELASKMEELGSYGLINTFAGMASHLFVASLVLAFLRLAQPMTRSSRMRAMVLVVASFSYVIYVLAYVGRDGVAYWGMTAFAIFIIFRPHLSPATRQAIRRNGGMLLAAMLVPFAVITLARFTDSSIGAAWSIPDYFGRQLQTFSDYSSVERPITLGAANFPQFISAGCAVAGLECPSWEDVRELVFAQYLAQDKEPWLFATFVSDFVGDFGEWGAFVLVLLLSLTTNALCRRSARGKPMTLARLLGILFLFLVPYWGVFYFRFSIINVFIVVNLLFIMLVAWFEARGRTRGRTRRAVSYRPSPSVAIVDAAGRSDE